MTRTGTYSLSVSLFQWNFQQMSDHFSLNASLKLAFGEKPSHLCKCFMYNARKYNAAISQAVMLPFTKNSLFLKLSTDTSLNLAITSIYFGLNE